MTSHQVKCYIYDISNGLAAAMSQSLIGRQINGIWHTGIVVYGTEYFFGGGSIERCPPGHTVLGEPKEKYHVGETEIPKEVFMDHLQELSTTSYSADKYNLLEHNCNTFSDEIARFLTGHGIPSHITSLPQEFMQTPFGQMVKPFIDSMSVNPGGESQPVFTASSSSASISKGASALPPLAAEPSTSGRPTHADIASATFTADISAYAANKDRIKECLDAQSFGLLEEVIEYLSITNCTWSLTPAHAQVIDTVLHDAKIDDVIRTTVAKLLQNLLLKENVAVQFARNPQSNKVLQKLLLATKFYTDDMQCIALRALSNVTAAASFRDALPVQNTDGVSVQGLCDACCACILRLPTSQVNCDAVALAYNLTHCKITGDHAMSLGGALIQFITTSKHPDSDKYSLTALLKCMEKNREVSAYAHIMHLKMDTGAKDDASLDQVRKRIQQKVEIHA